LRDDELTPPKVDLERSREHAEQARVVAEPFGRQLRGTRQSFVPAPEHRENVRLLTQHEPLATAVTCSAGERERLLEVVEAIAVAIALHRPVRKVPVPDYGRAQHALLQRVRK